VKHVLKISIGFAIVADKYWQALKAKEAFKGEWKKPKILFSSKKYRKECEKVTKNYEGKELLDEGNDYKKLDQEFEVEYSVPYLAHATLEPQNASVWVKNKEAEVWLPTQSPGAVRPIVSQITGIPRDKINVECSSLGGGFGRRTEMDALRNATEISYQIKKPVKLIYSREDDMKYGCYRPYVYSRLKASINKDATDIYWQQSIATQSMAKDVLPKMISLMTPPWMGHSFPKQLGKLALIFADSMSIKSGIRPPYNLKGSKVSWQKTNSPVTTQFWRSVGHSQNAFFVESFVDEIAQKAGIDPLKFRESRLSKDSRLLRVLKLVKEKSGWEKKKGKSLGIAVHFSYKSYAAAVIEIDQTEPLKVKNVWCALDCGIVMNPDGVHAQLMSSVIYGLTAALFGKIDIENGKVIQYNFDGYPLLTMNQTPNIYTEIVQSNEKPTGAGEPIVPVIAPALCNAIFKAKNKRIRHLPVSDHMDIS
jgi:isoquinoline 1-oxidoreductase subunit beta